MGNMDTVTYSQVQELVKRLPETKLTDAYRLLVELADQKADNLGAHSAFLRLPLSHRRRILTQQAEQIKAYYEQNADERLEWQAGDFSDEHSAW